MQSNFHSRIVAAVLAAGLAAVAASGAFIEPSNSPGSPPAAADSRSDFVAHCSECHGTDGRSRTPKGRKTEAPDLTKSTAGDAKIVRVITNGKSDMPPFKDKLNGDQINALVAYVRGLRK